MLQVASSESANTPFWPITRFFPCECAHAACSYTMSFGTNNLKCSRLVFLLRNKNGDFPNNIQQTRCAKSRPTRFNWQRPSESRHAATLPPALVDAWEAG
ncbi:hypothetical protein E4U54_008649 [Claviceps lovelessii]|nr:hypothetical protein E4U54_008649 [Claviceps lovelessii]